MTARSSQSHVIKPRSRRAPKTVDVLITEIKEKSEAIASLIQLVRALVKKSTPAVTEEVKYGGILFSSTAFCGAVAYKEHMTVEFSKGARIDDVWGYLEGGGKSRRHIKLFTAKDVRAKELTSYVPLAWEAARSVG